MNTADRLHGYMARWPDCPDDCKLQGIAGRVLDAARHLRDDAEAVGKGDFFSLIWHWLRHDSLNSGIQSRLTVPSHSAWPSASEWRDQGLGVADLGEKLTISAGSWRPQWLSGPLSAIDLALASPGELRCGELGSALPTRRRTYSGISADPFFVDVFPSSKGRERNYRTSVQRESLRAVLTAPPGASIVVSLPTGGGKSAVALVPSLIGSPDGLSVFVMPTTALALDQERAVQDYRPLRGTLHGPFAYHSELSPVEKSGFHSRIRSGEQRIVFTSPEAAIGSLADALFTAAKAGRLRYLVVDEAHMISEWGDEFRPEFQHLAGLRWDLLRVANQAPSCEAFRTLLLSATLTSTSLETLRALFGGEHFRVIGSVSIRPEPFFFLGSLPSREERLGRLPELITRLPKPLVVYVTKREDAERTTERLRDTGFRRIGMVTGGTSAADRRRIINEWRGTGVGTRIDVVVANSAFGLGIDMDEIRTVIHACIPETFDRFYQEVGRGGRDGHACLSVFLPVKSDEKIAKDMSKPTLIGPTKGLERWTHLLRNSTPLGDSCHRVDVRDLPPRLIDNSENRAWNLRTLALMCRAGLIRLRAEDPPKIGPEATDEERKAAHIEYRHTVVVELTDVDSLDSDAWRGQFQQTRSRTRAYFQSSLSRVYDLVRGGCPVEHAKLTYEVPPSLIAGEQEFAINPQGSCGGCVQHDFRAKARVLDIPVPPPQVSQLRIAPRLARLFRGKPTLVVTYSEGNSSSDLDGTFRRVVRMLLQNGIVEVVEDLDLASDPRVRQLHRRVPSGFVFFSRSLAGPNILSVPTAVFVSDTVPIRRSLFCRPSDSPPCVVIAPEDLPSPGKPDVPLGRGWSPHWPIADFEAALS